MTIEKKENLQENPKGKTKKNKIILKILLTGILLAGLVWLSVYRIQQVAKQRREQISSHAEAGKTEAITAPKA